MTYTGVQDQTIRPRTKRWSDSTWLKAIFAELRRTTSSRAQSEHGWRTFDSKPLDVAGGRATALRQRNDDSKQRRRRSGRRRPAEPPPAGWQGAESHCSLRFHEKYTHSLRDKRSALYINKQAQTKLPKGRYHIILQQLAAANSATQLPSIPPLWLVAGNVY